MKRITLLFDDVQRSIRNVLPSFSPQDGVRLGIFKIWKCVMLYIPWQDGFQLGLGVDLVTGGEVANGGVGIDSIDPPLSSDASNVQRTFSRVAVHGVQEASESLAAAINVAGKGIGWNATASANVKNSTTLNTNSISIRSMGFVQTEVGHLSNSQQLSETAANMMSDPVAFYQQYGRYFVAGWVEGSSFVANYISSFASAEAASQVRVTLKGEYKPAVADLEADAALQDDLKKLTSSTTTSVDVHLRSAAGWVEAEAADSIQGVEDAEAAWIKEISAGDGAVRMWAIVQPWTFLDQCHALPHLGPTTVPDSQASDAAEALCQLDAVRDALPTSDHADVNRLHEQLQATLSGYLWATPDRLSAAGHDLAVTVEQVAAWVDRANVSLKYDVEYQGQYHIAHKQLLSGNFTLNEEYFKNSGNKTLMQTNGNMTVLFGQWSTIASFKQEGQANDWDMQVKVDRDDAQTLRVSTRFGTGPITTQTASDSPAPVISVEGQPPAASSTFTPPAHTAADIDDQSGNCYVSARLIGPAVQ